MGLTPEQRTELDREAERIARSLAQANRDLAPLYGLPQPPPWEDRHKVVRLVESKAILTVLGHILENRIAAPQSTTASIPLERHLYEVERVRAETYDTGWRAAVHHINQMLDEGGEDGEGRMLAGALINRYFHLLDTEQHPGPDGLARLLRAWTGLNVLSATYRDGTLNVLLAGTQTDAAEFVSFWHGGGVEGGYEEAPGGWRIVLRQVKQPIEAEVEVPDDDGATVDEVFATEDRS